MMNSLTLKNHKLLVELLSKELGEVQFAHYPTENVVGAYVESAYQFKEWIVNIESNGCVYVKPTVNNSSFKMYYAFQGKPKMVAVWLYLSAWNDWPVSRSPKDVANRALRFIALTK